jgi:hypothetical protein
MTSFRAGLAVVLFASSFVYGQTTYYVSAAGSDANAGTSRERAWQTLAHDLRAGDRLLLRGGDTFRGTLRVAASNLTIASYGKGRATIDSGDADGIVVTNAGGLHIANVNVRGTSLGKLLLDRSGIAITNSGPRLNGITIDHVEVSGYTLAGILIRSGDRVSGFDRITIDTVDVHDTGYAGIALYGDERSTFRDVTVRHANVGNVTGYLTAYGVVVQGSGAGIAMNGVTTGTIAGNVVHDNGLSYGGGAYGIDLTRVLDMTIEENEVWSVNSVAPSGGGGGISIADASSMRIRYNYLHNNSGPGIHVCNCNGLAQDVTIHHNVLENNALSIDTADAVTAYHNTVFSGSGTALSIIGNSLFVNNVFLTNGGTLVEGSGSPTFLNDDFYDFPNAGRVVWNGTPMNVGAWASSIGAHILEVNPQLAHAGTAGTMFPKALSDLEHYRFAPNSPLLDSGLELEAHGITPNHRDFYAGFDRLNDHPDLGAYEYSGTPYAPSLDAIANASVPAGDAIEVDVWLRDADGASTVSLALVNAPSWATIRRVSASHAIVTLAPTLPGNATITVRATDDTGLTAQQTFTVSASGLLPRQRAVRK